MKESSWREQEALDRRLDEKDEERARLAFEAQAAQAEAEAARREADVQRRLVKRLQQEAAAAASGQEGGGGGGQLAELLQKRVKVLEAQNIKLRLQASAAAEAAAEAKEAAGRSRRSVAEGSAGGPASADETGQEGEEAEGAGGAGEAAENGSPNRAAAREAEGGSGGGGLLEGNPVLARWAADKRLQKKVEALQTKLKVLLSGAHSGVLMPICCVFILCEEIAWVAVPVLTLPSIPAACFINSRLQEKTTALVSAQAGRARAEEQAQALQAQVQAARAAAAQAAAAARQAEQRSAPGTWVPVGEHQQALRQLDDLQQRHDALERQNAALQHRVPSRTGEAGEADAQAGGGPCAAVSRSASAPLAGSKAYCPGAYGGSGGAAEPGADLQGQLLEKDVQLFDAQLACDQAAAEAERQRRRLHALLERLSPHPHDAAAAAAIAEACELAGLPALSKIAVTPAAAPATGRAAGSGRVASSAAAAGGVSGRRAAPSGREQELLAIVELLKAALERTKKGLESGVSSSKYMAVVEKAKALKQRCQELEEQLVGAAAVREELARVQRELGALHGASAALKSQLKAAREQREEAAGARERMLAGQVGGWVGEWMMGGWRRSSRACLRGWEHRYSA